MYNVCFFYTKNIEITNKYDKGKKHINSLKRENTELTEKCDNLNSEVKKNEKQRKI